jgi:hypothetical protein
VCTSPLPHTCHMPHPSHPSWSVHPNDIWWEAPHCAVFSSILLLPPSYALIPPLHPVLPHPQPAFVPQCYRPSFTPT